MQTTENRNCLQEFTSLREEYHDLIESHAHLRAAFDDFTSWIKKHPPNSTLAADEKKQGLRLCQDILNRMGENAEDLQRMYEESPSVSQETPQKSEKTAHRFFDLRRKFQDTCVCHDLGSEKDLSIH